MITIYTLSDPITNEIRYVGKTKRELRFRIYAHLSNYKLRHEKSHKNSWILSLKRINLNPIVEILDIVNEEDWEFWEIYWIYQIKSWGFDLTNMTKGGEGGSGKGPLGYKHTDEAKKRISIANSGRKSKEWLKNISESMKKPIIQYDLFGNFIKEWDSTTDAALYLGDIEKKKNISAVLNSKYNKKSAYGYIWKFKEIIELQDKELVR